MELPDDLDSQARYSWNDAYARCRAVAAEAFGPEHLRNLAGGEWSDAGRTVPHVSPVDGMAMVVRPWSTPTLPSKPSRALPGASGLEPHPARPAARTGERTLELMGAQRELLALLLVHEIGKPWRLALADVDRCLDGVRWYVDGIEDQLAASAIHVARCPGQSRTSPAGTTR